MKRNKNTMVRAARVACMATLMAFTGFLLSGAPLVPESLEEDRNEQVAAVLAGFIDHYNPRIQARERDELIEAIIRESRRLKVPDAMRIDGRRVDRLNFVTAFVKVESHFQRRAVSSADARGYMQLMPATALWMNERYGSDTPVEALFQADSNIAAGVQYLNHLMEFLDNPRHVALAYNAGPGNLQKGRTVERYWRKILRAYRELDTFCGVGFDCKTI